MDEGKGRWKEGNYLVEGKEGCKERGRGMEGELVEGRREGEEGLMSFNCCICVRMTERGNILMDGKK